MMKRLILLLVLSVSFGLATPAHADPSVSLEDDPIFSDAADPTFADGNSGPQERDEGGSLEQAAERFSLSCYQDLGPGSACFEDYETENCASSRTSCRMAGSYSR